VNKVFSTFNYMLWFLILSGSRIYVSLGGDVVVRSNQHLNLSYIIFRNYQQKISHGWFLFRMMYEEKIPYKKKYNIISFRVIRLLIWNFNLKKAWPILVKFSILMYFNLMTSSILNFYHYTFFQYIRSVQNFINFHSINFFLFHIPFHGIIFRPLVKNLIDIHICTNPSDMYLYVL
jgi:hypothetical protein